MKHIYTTLLLCLVALAGQAQVNFVREFPGYTTAVFTAVNGAKVAVPGEGGSVVLFNTDGTHFRTIRMPSQGGGIFLSDYPMTAIGDMLFDTDEQLEGLGWVLENGHRVPAIIEETGRFTKLPLPAGSMRDFLSVRLFNSGGTAYALVAMDSVVRGDTSNHYQGYKTFLYALPGSLPTSTLSRSGQEMVVWPVPASGQFSVRLPRPAQTGEALHMFDVTGQAVRRVDLRQGASGLEVETSGLAPGVYTLRGAGFETNLVVQ